MINRTKGLPVLCALVVGSLVAGGSGVEADDATKPGPTVKVVVDFADGVEKHFTRVSWTQGMTVLDAMNTVAKHPRGIEVRYRGRGSTTLLVRIDDLENEGNGRNWIYRVNHKLADRGIGAYRLASGDTILWRFEKYR
jgi:hypothetical protein